MIPTPSFISCDTKGYDFTIGRFNRFIFIGRPMIAFVNGGVPPYTWTITGNEFDLAQAVTSSQFNRIVTNGNTVVRDSVEEVTVSDSCGQEATFIVTCCSRYLCCDQQTIPFRVDQIDYVPSRDVIVKIYGGCPPFYWQTFDVRGSFATPWTETRQNTLIFVDSHDVIGIEYKVTDICGSVAGGFVYEQVYDYQYYFFGAKDSSMIPDHPSQSIPDPTAIPSIEGSRVEYFSTGMGSSVARTVNKKCYCVGSNGDGQLGLGHTTNWVLDITPMELPYPGAILTSCSYRGFYYGIAIFDDSQMYAAGRNNRGQLGIGEAGGRSSWTHIPGDWRYVDTHGMMHSGDGLSAAIDSEGRLFCWGYNYYKAMPMSQSNGYFSPVDVSEKIPDRSGMKEIYFLERGMIGVTFKGALVGTGDSYYSGTGSSSYGVFKDCVFAGGPDDFVGVKRLATTSNSCAMVDISGKLWVFGADSNTNGIIGLGAGVKYQRIFTQLGNESDWVDVVCHEASTFAWKSDGRVFRWGSSYLGDSTTASPCWDPTVWAHTIYLPGDRKRSARGTVVKEII